MPTKDNPFCRSHASEMLRGTACVCLTFMLLPLAIYAQSATSKLVGLVTDVSGVVVPDAKVTVIIRRRESRGLPSPIRAVNTLFRFSTPADIR